MTETSENTKANQVQDGSRSGKKGGVPLSAKEEFSEFFKTAVLAVLLAIILRSLLFEPFNIPSGSMKPTLEVGDYLFVYKPSYGYSRYSFPFGLAPIKDRLWAKEPERGDVVVFKLPTNQSIDYIKRVVALPGDRVQMKRGRLYINNNIIPRERVGIVNEETPHKGMVTMVKYRQVLPNGVSFYIYEEGDNMPLDNTQAFKVPEGHYFVMGDNRDNSQDSRVQQAVGMVPFDHLVGRADFLFFSIDETASLFTPWKWPWAVRYERLFTSIGPENTEQKDVKAATP